MKLQCLCRSLSRLELTFPERECHKNVADQHFKALPQEVSLQKVYEVTRVKVILTFYMECHRIYFLFTFYVRIWRMMNVGYWYCLVVTYLCMYRIAGLTEVIMPFLPVNSSFTVSSNSFQRKVTYQNEYMFINIFIEVC